MGVSTAGIGVFVGGAAVGGIGVLVGETVGNTVGIGVSTGATIFLVGDIEDVLLVGLLL